MDAEIQEKVQPPVLRLTPSEAEALIQAKLMEAKRQRLSEVRQQSRNLTLRIKQCKHEKVAKVLARTKVTLVRQSEEQLEKLRQEAEVFLVEEMSHFGEGHNKASAQPDFAASKELANASNKRLAKRRGVEAFQENKLQKDLTQQKATAHIKARKAALQVEAVRAAYQASKPTPKTLLTRPKPPPLPKAVIYQYGSLYQSTFHPPASIIQTHSENAACDPREAARLEEERIAEMKRCQEEQRLLAKRRGAVALAYEKNAVQWRKRLHELEEEHEESLERSLDPANLPEEGQPPVSTTTEKRQKPIEDETPVPAENDIVELHPTHYSVSRVPLTSPGPENQLSSSSDEPTLDPELLNQLRDLLKKIPRRQEPSEAQDIPPQRTVDEVQDIPSRRTLPDLQEFPQRDLTTVPSTSSESHQSVPEHAVQSSQQTQIQGNLESGSTGSFEVSVKVIERFDNAIEKSLYRKSFKTTSKENIPPSSHSSTRYRDMPRKLGKSVSSENVSQSKFETPAQNTRREILKRYIEKLLQSQREELVNLSNTTDSSLLSSIHLGAEARDFPKPTTRSESLTSASPSVRGDQIDFQLIPRVPPFSNSWPSFASASSATSVSSKQSSLPSFGLTESPHSSLYLSRSKQGKDVSIRSEGDSRALRKGNVSKSQSEDSLKARLHWLEEQVESKEEGSKPLPLSALLKEFRRSPDSEEKRTQVYSELASLQSFSVSRSSFKSKSSVESSTDISVPDVDAALRRLGMPALTAVLRR